MGQSNLTLIYENYADRGTLSGGSWQTGSLGLANLQTPYLAEVARSTSADPAASTFRIQFDSFRTIGGIAFGPCNVRPSALCRFRGYNQTDLIYDSGLLRFPGSFVENSFIPWEDAGFWEGKQSELSDPLKGPVMIAVLDQPALLNSIVVEIFDAGNPDGYIEIGRLICGRTWVPEYNYNYEGNSLDFEAITDVEESRSGVRFYNPRAMRRSFTFGFDYLPEDTAFREVYRIATQSGVHRQVVVVPNPGDPDTFGREAFVGTLSTPPSLRRSTFQRAATSFKIEETL